MNTVGEALFKWSWWIMGYQIGFSIIIGFVVGFIARKILRFSEERYCDSYYLFQDKILTFVIYKHKENGLTKNLSWFMLLH